MLNNSGLVDCTEFACGAHGRFSHDVVTSAIVEPSGVLHLMELVPLVRLRLGIGADFKDDAILASLNAITAHDNGYDRAEVAFECDLGLHLDRTRTERDLTSAVIALLALLPNASNGKPLASS